MLKHEPTGPVLLAGGYGVVGAELAALLRRDQPDLPLLLAGRRPDRGAATASAVGAQVVRWDLAAGAPPAAGVRAVVTAANDSADAALRACLAAGIPYVDVTRWTSRLQRALAVVAAQPPRALVALSSGWMGGLVPRLAGYLGGQVGGATEVDVAVRYDVADRAGADSVDFMDRLGLAFEVGATGAERVVTPLTDVRRVQIGADWVRVARIDTPEQFTLPLTLGVRHATTRLGFSDGAATAGLLALRRVGFFRLADGDRLRGLRRGLLHRPGPGGEARLRVEVTGPAGAASAVVVDPAGQAHLTAVGALLSLYDALRPGAGVVFPELSAASDLPARLADLGVDVARRDDAQAA
jgi:hypothetical protein